MSKESIKDYYDNLRLPFKEEDVILVKAKINKSGLKFLFTLEEQEAREIAFLVKTIKKDIPTGEFHVKIESLDGIYGFTDQFDYTLKLRFSEGLRGRLLCQPLWNRNLGDVGFPVVVSF